MPAKQKRLGKWVRFVIGEYQSGKTLCRSQHMTPQGETKIEWFFEPGGRNAPPVSAEKATKTEFLVANEDGLLPGHGQT